MSAANPPSSCHRPTGGSRRRNRGFALLIVIWVLALLTLLATELAGTSRTAALLARNGFETAHARALAEAGVTQAILGLLAPYDGSPWHLDGRVRQFAYDGGQLAVSIQDEGGKIDLNAAPIEVIAGLMGELGVDSAQAAAIADEIVLQRRTRGTRESRAFVPALARGPVDQRVYRAPFPRVEALRSLPSMTRDAYERMRPFVTVFSGSDRVNLLTAPREVLLALPGVRLDEIDALLGARAAPEQQGVFTQLPRLAGAARYIGGTNAQIATILAQATTERGASLIREAVVALGDEPSQPYRILAWRQLAVAGDAAAAAAR